MKRNYLSKWAALFFILFFSVSCFAAVVSPTTQVQNEATRMIAKLDANKSQLKNLNVVRGIVSSVFLPNVDLDRMSAAVVGRAWQNATSTQRSQFKKEFSYLVTTTYAAALSDYDHDKVMVRPFRGNYASQQTVTVSTVILRKSGQRITVNYNLDRAGDRWKVYDFSIENVSMVQSYRSQFSSVLAQGGMPALLQRMRSHNSKT